MKKIIEYKIVIENDVIELERLVSHFISIGWEPIGGVSFRQSTLNHMEHSYYQSIIKREE